MKPLSTSLIWLAMAQPAFAATVTIQLSGSAPYELGSNVWLTTKVDGKSQMMKLAVNGIVGGNSTVGTINNQNGLFVAPTAMPANQQVTITATSLTDPSITGSQVVTLKPATPAITSITPTLVPCGSEFTITLNGQRFAADQVVYIRNAPVTTTYVSPTQLQAKYKTGISNGTLSIKVVSPVIGTSAENYSVKTDTCASTTPTPSPSPSPTPSPSPSPSPAPTPAPVVIGPQAAQDAQTVPAARFLEKASFGPTSAEIARLKQIGVDAWLTEQMAPELASPIVNTSDLTVLRNAWYTNMVNGKDQLRQRMVFALSQLFVVSADKNPYGNEMRPWLVTLDKHAFGNFNDLLREMSLNPSMGKYLDLGNSVMPSPNENYAREVMQLFSIGTIKLNTDGTPMLDSYGNTIPTYNQSTIAAVSRALSGWTYTGPSATGINWENFTGPLQPRNNYHDKGAKTMLDGYTLAAGGTVQSDFDAVMNMLFNHPNTAPFIASRLIKAFTTSNPSPAYVQRVADVFANGPKGRGDLGDTLKAILTDPEALATTGAPGRLKDPMLHTISLMRAMDATLVDPSNLFWEYYLVGQKIMNSPSVFNFYSPLTRLPGNPTYYGPEFQIYAPSLAITRANLLYNLVTGQYNGMVKFDITPYVNVAGDPTALLNMVDAKLLQNRMSAAARTQIGNAILASSDNKQRAITALYLTAITGEFAVQQ